MVTQATAAVHADGGVRLSTIVPALMETPYMRQLFKRVLVKVGYKKLRRARGSQLPLGRMRDTKDIVHKALF